MPDNHIITGAQTLRENVGGEPTKLVLDAIRPSLDEFRSAL